MIRQIQNSFVSGVLSPTLHGRHDLKAYFSGAESLTNFIVRKAGGLQKRAGTDIALDLTPFPGCRVIPFYYDRTRSILLLLWDETVRFITQTDGAHAIVQADAADYTLDTQWPDSALPELRHYQVGDTVFLTCPGYQACKLVRVSDDNWTLSYLTGAVSVPAAPGLTATPADFGTSGAASTAYYALYAVKNGVISAPSTASAAIRLPWPSGATVSLGFTPNLSAGVDGYILGKQNGAYYGLLARFYPVRTAVSLTDKTYSTSGVSSAGDAADHLFHATHATALAGSNPDYESAQPILLHLTEYAVHVARPSEGAEPYCEYASGTAYALSSVRVWFGGICADAAKQNRIRVDYASAEAPNVLLEGWYSSAWHTLYEGPTGDIPTGISGYVDLAVADTNTMTKTRLTVYTPDAGDTGFMLRGIALYNRAGTPALVTSGAWSQPVTALLFTVLLVSGTTYLNTKHAITDLEVTGATDRDALDTHECSPARTLKTHAYAIAVAPVEGYATVALASASAFATAEIRIWPGARVTTSPLYTHTQTRDQITSNTASYQLEYTLDNTNWSLLDDVYTLADQYAEQPVSCLHEVDPAVAATVKGWRIKILAADPALPVILRGVKFLATSIASSFSDANHQPTELIDAQTYVHPGSSDMDVDCVGIYQQRLVLAASAGLPFTVWVSKTGDLYMWYANATLTDTDPFSITIPAERASRIRHVLSERRFIIFTEGGVYVMEGSDSEGFSYRTAKLTKVANYGCSDVPPHAAQNTVLFVLDDRRTITELRYDLAQDGLVPVDRSVLAAHLTEASGVAATAWQAAPNAVLWVLLDDGTLLSFTYMPDHEVYAWASHAVDGATLTGLIATHAHDEAADTETSSQIYLTADCGTSSYLLRLRPQIASDAPAVAAAACLDIAQRVTFAGATTPATPAFPYPAGDAITAVSLTDGATVDLTADGSGDLIPGAPAGDYIVGYPVAAAGVTLRPELPDRNIQGLRKNIADALLRVHRARHVAVAPHGQSLADVQDQTELAAVSAGRVPLPSGDRKAAPFGSWNDDARLAFSSPDVWPCEILAAVFTIELESPR